MVRNGRIAIAATVGLVLTILASHYIWEVFFRDIAERHRLEFQKTKWQNDYYVNQP